MEVAAIWAATTTGIITVQYFISKFDFGKVYRQIDPNVSAPETICNETNLTPPQCHEIWHKK